MRAASPQTSAMTPSPPRRCQAEDQGAQLCLADRELVSATWRWPYESALVQFARAQPDADPVMHENLHSVTALIGEEVGMVGVCCPEDDDHARQYRLGAGTHVHRGDGQPGGIDADHRSQSRNQTPQDEAQSVGQLMETTADPRRTSTWIALLGPLVSDCTAVVAVSASITVASCS